MSPWVISDLTAFYERLVEEIFQQGTLASGAKGYYFPLAHDFNWWEALDQMAVALNARGLVTDSKTQIWSYDEVAAESLKLPVQYVQLLSNSG